jgi:rhodanese-related sulfurtransferase
MNVAMNKAGYESFDKVLSRGMKALNPEEFEQAANQTEALILDTRPAEEFCLGFIPRSVNIGLRGDFAPWVGALLVDVKQELLLVCRPGEEEEAITRLSRIGFDRVIGYLRGGYESWKKSGKEEDKVNRIQAADFSRKAESGPCQIFDLRREAEFNTGHLENAENRPLDFINDWSGKVSSNEKPLFIHCAGGYRSMIAASILKARGFHDFYEVEGGFKAIASCGLPITESSCSG